MDNDILIGPLRDALKHLYDPDRLQRNPLIRLLGLDSQANPPRELRQILIHEIAALEPNPDVPSHSRAWRIYDLLFCRYVQQLSTKVVSDQLGISNRHLRREQQTALEALAYRLRETYALEDLDAQEEAATTSDGSAEAERCSPSVSDELAWLREYVAEEPTSVYGIMSDVLDLVAPLADRHDVDLHVQLAADLPPLATHPVALNQLFLNLLSVAISWMSGGDVDLEVKASKREVIWSLSGERSTEPEAPLSESDSASLAMAHELAEASGCKLHLVTTKLVFAAHLSLSLFDQVPILIVDDNIDTLRLYDHFVAGTRYELLSARDPEQALEIAQKAMPQIVVLDVMMPQVDGWQVLGRFRQHPATRNIPIIVCTILAQEELAMSLGSSAFLRKPISQEQFLSALDRQMASVK